MINSLSDLRFLQRQGDLVLASLLSDIKNRAAEVVLFGAGEAGQLIKKVLNDHDVYPTYFTDNSPDRWHAKVNGSLVLPPSHLTQIQGLFVIICSWDTEGIVKQLKQMNIQNYDNSLYAKILSTQNRSLYLNSSKKIEDLAYRLADDRSREVLFGLIEHAFSLDDEILNHIYEQNQYFIDSRFYIKPDEVIVDGGSFRGDTVADMIARFGKTFHSIHCFEPNASNYSSLVDFIKEQQLESCVITHNVGLSDRERVLCFSGSGSGFHLNADIEDGAERVQLVSLDGSLFATTRINSIKLDIEGAEVDALKGAEKIIKRDRPRLAVCVYHVPEHLWEIPMLIASILPEYKLYLRHHTPNLYETVVYAIIDQ